MGCCQSKVKEPPPRARDEAFVDITVRGYATYLKQATWMNPSLRRLEFVAFGHTLVNLLVQNMEEASKSSVNTMLRARLAQLDFAAEPEWLEAIGTRTLGTEGVLDKALERLLFVAFQSNPENRPTFTTSEAANPGIARATTKMFSSRS